MNSKLGSAQSAHTRVHDCVSPPPFPNGRYDFMCYISVARRTRQNAPGLGGKEWHTDQGETKSMFRLQCFAMEHSRKEHSTITRRDQSGATPTPASLACREARWPREVGRGQHRGACQGWGPGGQETLHFTGERRLASWLDSGARGTEGRAGADAAFPRERAGKPPPPGGGQDPFTLRGGRAL